MPDHLSFSPKNAIDPYLEMIDDPTLPFGKRWELTYELDQINQKFGVYKYFLKKWEQLLREKSPNQKITILEVGSGSGGLSLEIQKWMRKHFNQEIEFHLYDSQEDILEKSRTRFEKHIPQIHIATDKHLEIFETKSFDFVISLNVIHHIHPIEVAALAIEEMARISKSGILIMDLMKKPLAIPIAHFFQFLFSITDDLGEDGIKSIQRSHSFKDLKEKLETNGRFKNFKMRMHSHPIYPYWTLMAVQD